MDEWYIGEERDSLDLKSDGRGEKLLSLMETSGLILINGRTESDCPANYTFVNKNGKSIIDLFWSNLLGAVYVRDLNVNYIVTASDHFPVIVTLNILIQSNKVKPGLKWNSIKKNEYIAIMQSSIFDYNSCADINKLESDLTAWIGQYPI